MDETLRWVDAGGGLLWLALGLYGLTALLLDGARLLRRLRPGDPRAALSVVMLVRNQEDWVEQVVSLLEKEPWGEGLRWELVVVDADSSDHTPVVLERLCRERVHMRLAQLSPANCESICEAAVFLCRHPLILLLDLRLPDSGAQAAKGLAAMWK